MVRDRRIGKFEIYAEFVNSAPKMIREIMGKCIILRAEWMGHSNSIEYIAICDDFEEEPQGIITPSYRVLIRKEVSGDVFDGFQKI